MKNIEDRDFLDFSDVLGEGVKALFSLASSGDMADEENRAAFARKHFKNARPVRAEQIHGTRIAFADLQTNVPVPETDALVTNDRNVVLCILTADCIPVYFNDAVSGFAGIIHAGWRGISSNFVISAVDTIQKNYPVDLFSMKIVVGPGICTNHFEVSAELAHVFPEIFVKSRKDRFFVDLKKIIKEQLVNSGLNGKNIYDCRICSFEEKNIFSYRRDKTASRNCAFLRIL